MGIPQPPSPIPVDHNRPARLGIFARRLESRVGTHGNIPGAVAERYVDALVEVYLTNGNGVAWTAEPIYVELLGKFDVPQALLAFRRLEISSKLQFPLVRQK